MSLKPGRRSQKVDNVMRSSLIVSSLLLGGVIVACANGTDPSLTGDTGDGTDTDSGVTTFPPDNSDGGSTTNPYAAPADGGKPVHDGSASNTPDSGSQSAKDSGTTPPPPGTGDCVGEQGSQLSLAYDDECDNYWFNHFNILTGKSKSNPCALGKGDCAKLNSGGTTFCCYPAPSGGFCNDDYNGTPQCVPE